MSAILWCALSRLSAPRRARRYGYRGFYDKHDKPVVLTPRSVDSIQLQGGTILGTSRGGADLECAPAPAVSNACIICC